MVRPPCCDKPSVRRGLWTTEEDAKMLAYVSKHGTGNWTNVPKKAGLRRCGKSCRLRWTNYLRPDLKHEGFTPQEEELIVKLHATLGSRWAIIAQQLPGRTDNDVKNYWNTKLKKKLTEMGIDPVTHKPFSQILADYGNIGGLPKSGNRISSFNRDLKNAFIAKPADQYPTPAEANPDISSHLMTPKLEQFQERFLNSTDNNNHSLDLLEQLQAIKLVTEASHCTKYEPPTSPYFLNEGSFSSSATSSSSSTCSTAAQAKSPLSFSWQDFLLEDAFLPTDSLDQTVELSSQEEFTSQTQNFTPPQGQQVGEDQGMEMAAFPSSSNGNQVQYPSHSSFIEGILDTQNETFMAIPDILEEPFYY